MMRISALFFAILIGWLLFTTADAAVTPNSFVAPQVVNRGIVQFLQGTDAAGTYKTVYTAGANGSRCNGLWMSTTDGTTTHLVTVQIVNSTVKYGGVAVTTVLGSGFTTAVPPQNMFSPTVWVGLPLDQFSNPYLQLISGDTLQVTFATALTAATVINLVASCSDY